MSLKDYQSLPKHSCRVRISQYRHTMATLCSCSNCIVNVLVDDDNDNLILEDGCVTV